MAVAAVDPAPEAPSAGIGALAERYDPDAIDLPGGEARVRLQIDGDRVWDAVLTKQFGGTPGKLVLGMRVVRADNGDRVEWSHAIIRWAVPGALALVPIPVLPGLVNFVIFIVSLVFIFTKPLRQAVWDLVAKTLVVKAR